MSYLYGGVYDNGFTSIFLKEQAPMKWPVIVIDEHGVTHRMNAHEGRVCLQEMIDLGSRWCLGCDAFVKLKEILPDDALVTCLGCIARRAPWV